MKVFKEAHLTQYHLDKLFTIFDDIDKDGSGLVRMDEFFSFFRLEDSDFNRELFRTFDSDGSGELSFLEFVCVVSDNAILGSSRFYSLCSILFPSGRALVSNLCE